MGWDRREVEMRVDGGEERECLLTRATSVYKDEYLLLWWGGGMVGHGWNGLDGGVVFSPRFLALSLNRPFGVPPETRTMETVDGGATRICAPTQAEAQRITARDLRRES